MLLFKFCSDAVYLLSIFIAQLDDAIELYQIEAGAFQNSLGNINTNK